MNQDHFTLLHLYCDFLGGQRFHGVRPRPLIRPETGALLTSVILLIKHHRPLSL